MKLYIANCTQQNFTMYYRVQENPSPRMTVIPLGGQSMLDLNGPQIDYVIEQMRKYGLMGTDEIGRLDPQRVITLLFNRDRPVSASHMRSIMAHNFNVQRRLGEETRKAAAIASDQAIVKSLEREPDLGSLKLLEVSVSEDNPGSVERTGEPINNGHRIIHDNADQSPPTRRQQRRRGGSAHAAAN